MLEKKRQEKIRPVVELEKTVAEIVVANGRSVEPFVKVFGYSDENVVKSSLGTLIGVFEIAERSEESAYIVNFLASVAKKEYFANPRRGAVESFEAALHKINLALAELVKHGNVAWLGKFHGALGILEKSNFHFSLTGEANIILLRNGAVSDIGAGLASEESSLHPLKTFVEVASGRMLADDKVILASPELFGLLSLPDLEKNALRMDADRFIQFLRTALVNELDMAGTLIIDFREGVPVPDRQAAETRETPRNVFSQQAFVPPIKTRADSSSQPANEKHEDAPLEYVDSKTGHIYVQGDTPGRPSAHQGLERVKLALQDMLHRTGSSIAAQGKLLRKGRKQGLMALTALAGQGRVALRRAARFSRRQWRRMAAMRRRTVLVQSSPVPETRRDAVARPILPEPTPLASPPSPIETGEDADIPDFMRQKLSAFYRRNGIQEPAVPRQQPPAVHVRNTLGTIASPIRNICQAGYSRCHAQMRQVSFAIRNIHGRLFSRWDGLPRQHRRFALIGIIAAIIALGGGAFFSLRPSQTDIPSPITEAPQPEAFALFLETEKNARLLETPATLATQEEGIIASVSLDDAIYIITAGSIIDVREDRQYALPAGSGAVLLAAPMDDLRLIFIHTDAGELFAWSPINHAFVRNTLALPAGASVRDIGTYLTYLYVLDDANDQIYRFPRAEGGFGSASLWLKDPVAFEGSSHMAISETIFVAPNKDTIQAFFRGKFVRNLESPNSPLSITGLFTSPDLANVYALDAENKRIIVWNQDGVLIAQYFSEQLSEAQTITVDEKTNEVFIATTHSLLSGKITPGQ